MPFREDYEREHERQDREAKKNALAEARVAPLYEMPLGKLAKLAKEQSARAEKREFEQRLMAWMHRRPAYVCSEANARILCDAAFQFLADSGRADQQPTDFDLDAALDSCGPSGSNQLEVRREYYTGRLTPDSRTLTDEQLREASLGHDPRERTL